jgi:sulfocyanin
MIKPVTLTRFGIVLALTAAAFVACGSSGSKAKSTSAMVAAAPGGAATAVMISYSGSDKILASDAAAKTVTVNLIAGQGAAAKGFNFNGYSNGDMHIQVPTGWRVKVSMIDESNTPHSALIVPWEERQGGALHAAFAHSAPADFRSGIEKGDDPQKFTFTADTAGEYAIVCGVPGHIDAGMWDAFDVVDNLAAPQVLAKQ